MNQFFSPLVERAMRVAAHQHRNHHRKASGLPYISHPCSVSLILLKAEFDGNERHTEPLAKDAKILSPTLPAARIEERRDCPKVVAGHAVASLLALRAMQAVTVRCAERQYL